MKENILRTIGIIGFLILMGAVGSSEIERMGTIEMLAFGITGISIMYFAKRGLEKNE